MTLKKIGNIIRDARIQKGLTQVQVANRAGIRQATIADIEAGKTNFRIDTLMAVAKALDCTVAVILNHRS